MKTRSTPVNRISGYNRGLVAQTGLLPEGSMLLQDFYPMEVLHCDKLVTEGVGGRERPALRVTGLIQLGDSENANGRVYPTDILGEAVMTIQEDVGRRAVIGELDHPPEAKIHLDRASHLMTKVWMEGKKVYGEAEILDAMPCGAMLRALFDSKVQVGISSRGVGDLEVMESNGKETHRVCPGFQIITWDMVAEPSVSGAVMRIMENKLRPLNKVLNKEVKKGFLSQEAKEELLIAAIKKHFR